MVIYMAAVFREDLDLLRTRQCRLSNLDEEN